MIEPELTREFLADRLLKVSYALLNLSNLYWDAGSEKHGHSPARCFDPMWVDAAWKNARAAMDSLTTENQTTTISLHMDVLHRARRII